MLLGMEKAFAAGFQGSTYFHTHPLGDVALLSVRRLGRRVSQLPR